MGLEIRPTTLAQANDLVAKLHRHHKPCTGHRFSLACYRDGILAGVVICGRPVARKCDQNLILEITRCATDGSHNTISKLYGAVYRTAKAMGFKRIQTYTLPEEGGASLKASGFRFDGEAGGGDWNSPSRKGRRIDQPQGKKWRWVIDL